MCQVIFWILCAFAISIKESKIQNVDIIVDKGFGSEKNLLELESNLINYIVPLKRDNKLVSEEEIFQSPVFTKKFDDNFIWSGRPIWYKTKKLSNNRTLHMYLDISMKAKEEKDYLLSIDKNLEGYTKEEYFKKEGMMGTISMITNKNDSAEKIYTAYKTRLFIEEMFSGLFDFIEADVSYMQNEFAFEGMAFVKHIALTLVYSIYQKLKISKLLKKYSAKDIISICKNIKKVKIEDEWILTEITDKIKTDFKKMGVHIA